MTNPVLSVAGLTASAATLFVPWEGLWICDLDLPSDSVPTGRVEVRIGDLTLSGTVDDTRSGAFRSGARVRVIAGAGGWQRAATRRHFHADQGLRRSTVLLDTARAVGEQLVVDTAADAVIGLDFVRQDTSEASGRPLPASAHFARAGAPLWWVGYDGITHVAAERPSPASGDVQILDVEPRLRTATLGGIAPVEVGAVLPINGVDHIVRELRVEVTPHHARTVAIFADVAVNRLHDAIASIARQVASERLHGIYQYRVSDMVEARARLQRSTLGAIPGLPDVLLVPQAPGTAGLWASLQPGAQVLVQFVEGLVSRPYITHAEPYDGAGFVPVELLVDASSMLRLGPSADSVELAGGGAAVHRVGDLSDAGVFAPAVAPATLLYTSPNGKGWTLTLAAGATPVTAVLAPLVPGDPVGALTAQASTGSDKVTAG